MNTVSQADALSGRVIGPGDVLGRYELLLPVAAGGMAMVWAARLKGPRGFQKLVAIKTLLPELRHDPRIEQMLLEEARIASAIQHPHVVQTTELGEHRGYLYLVMEWIDGESLSFVLKRGEERGAMPVAVATLTESAPDAIPMPTRASANAIAAWLRPSPSAPTRSATARSACAAAKTSSR